jgi:hypothetical protein
MMPGVQTLLVVLKGKNKQGENGAGFTPQTWTNPPQASAARKT